MSKKNRRERRLQLGLPSLEVMAHQMAYEAVVKEEYERAKAAHAAKTASSGFREAKSDHRLQSSDMEGG